MKRIQFAKMSGSGNDFILIDNRRGAVGEQEMPRVVERACRRRISVGADGVIFVVPSGRCDFAWRFFNADGGEVEMCGNGSRCVARYAYLKGIAGPTMTFETLAGPISAEVMDRRVKVRMPKPGPVLLDLPLESREGWASCDFVNTGVPHVVVGVEALENHPVTDQGRAIRWHPHFAPEGTNANFMKRVGSHRIRVRTYERGVEDETLACGTGSIASALVAAARGMVSSPVTVETWGGEELVIHFDQKGDAFDEVWLEGNTTLVYEGELGPEALEP